MDYSRASESIASTTHYHDLSGLQSIKKEKTQSDSLRKVAEQFESMFLHELLKNMRKANQVFEKDSLFSNSESTLFRDMHDQQLSVELSGKGGLGLSELLYQQLNREYGENEAPARTEVHSVPKRSSDVPPLQTHTPMSHQDTTMKPNQSTSNEERPTLEEGTKVPAIHTFDSPSAFVDFLKPMANAAAKHFGLDPLIFVAQAALETGWGKSVVKHVSGEFSHNLFNIKADSRWQGEAVTKTAVEYKDGIAVMEQSGFRKYESYLQSFEDYIDFLQSNPRYANAIHQPKSEADFMFGLQEAGYATDPKYAEKVLDVYKRLQSQEDSSEAASD